MRVIFMGTPEPVAPILERLCQMPEIDVVAAVTPPDRGQGRGRRAAPSPVKAAAQSLGVPVWQPDGLRSPESLAHLAALRPDLIVVAAYRLFLPPPALALPRYGCLNLHPSLLPRHRGASPTAAAILAGDAVTGVSLMLLDQGMDTGPVIAQRKYPLTGQETAGELTAALFALGADLLAETLPPWTRGELPAQPQDEAQATLSRQLERHDGQADWTESALTLERRHRAYAPWPGLHTPWQGQTLKLLELSAMPDASAGTAAPGKVIASDSGKGLSVVTGQGILTLDRLQLEGRRPVTGAEFVRGYPEILGANLGDQQTKP